MWSLKWFFFTGYLEIFLHFTWTLARSDRFYCFLAGILRQSEFVFNFALIHYRRRHTTIQRGLTQFYISTKTQLFSFGVSLFHCRLVRFLFLSYIYSKTLFCVPILALVFMIGFSNWTLTGIKVYFNVYILQLVTLQSILNDFRLIKRNVLFYLSSFKKSVSQYSIVISSPSFSAKLFLSWRFRKDKVICAIISVCKINWNVTERAIWDSYFVFHSLAVSLHSRLNIAGFISGKPTHEAGDRSERLSNTEVYLPRKRANFITIIKQSIS